MDEDTNLRFPCVYVLLTEITKERITLFVSTQQLTLSFLTPTLILTFFDSRHGSASSRVLARRSGGGERRASRWFATSLCLPRWLREGRMTVARRRMEGWLHENVCDQTKDAWFACCRGTHLIDSCPPSQSKNRARSVQDVGILLSGVHVGLLLTGVYTPAGRVTGGVALRLPPGREQQRSDI